MRIVDRKTFLAMPAGTLFAKFDPHVFGELQIKADTCGNDFVCNGLMPYWWEDCQDSGDALSIIDRMMEGESSPPLDYDSYGRDGLFDADQLFAVFEPADVRALMTHLTEMLTFQNAPTPEVASEVCASGQAPGGQNEPS